MCVLAGVCVWENAKITVKEEEEEANDDNGGGGDTIYRNDKKNKNQSIFDFWLGMLHTMLTKTYKLVLGIILLLVVDIIWVSSSELTKV